jgi:hypothetical protein
VVYIDLDAKLDPLRLLQVAPQLLIGTGAGVRKCEGEKVRGQEKGREQRRGDKYAYTFTRGIKV